MGYYTEISKSEYAAKDVALYNRMNGVSGHTVAGVVATQVAPQLLQFTIGRILSGSEKNENETNTGNSSENTERTRLQKELKSALKDIGVDHEKDIETKIAEVRTEGQNNIAKAQENVNKYKTVEQYDADIENQQNALNSLNDTNDPDGTKRKEIEKQIEALQSDKKARQDAENELRKVTEAENAKLIKLNQRAEDANDIIKQLNALDNNSVEKQETAKVESQYNELQTFNDAYKNYKKSPSKETALALQKAYQDCPQDSPNYKNISTLYKMYQKDVEGLL